MRPDFSIHLLPCALTFLLISNPAMQNGMCTRTTSNGNPDFKCTCESGFTGRRCSKNVCDPTPNGPCLNDGKCVVVSKEGADDDFKCEW